MLVSSDYDLSLSLRYEEPVKEALKETILRQEYTFKKQVLNYTYYIFCLRPQNESSLILKKVL